MEQKEEKDGLNSEDRGSGRLVEDNCLSCSVLPLK